jgi:hypothetical protein
MPFVTYRIFEKGRITIRPYSAFALRELACESIPCSEIGSTFRLISYWNGFGHVASRKKLSEI